MNPCAKNNKRVASYERAWDVITVRLWLADVRSLSGGCARPAHDPVSRSPISPFKTTNLKAAIKSV